MLVKPLLNNFKSNTRIGSCMILGVDVVQDLYIVEIWIGYSAFTKSILEQYLEWKSALYTC